MRRDATGLRFFAPSAWESATLWRPVCSLQQSCPSAAIASPSPVLVEEAYAFPVSDPSLVDPLQFA